jgi:hypothetical protein
MITNEMIFLGIVIIVVVLYFCKQNNIEGWKDKDGKNVLFQKDTSRTDKAYLKTGNARGVDTQSGDTFTYFFNKDSGSAYGDWDQATHFKKYAPKCADEGRNIIFTYDGCTSIKGTSDHKWRDGCHPMFTPGYTKKDGKWTKAQSWHPTQASIKSPYMFVITKKAIFPDNGGKGLPDGTWVVRDNEYFIIMDQLINLKKSKDIRITKHGTCKDRSGISDDKPDDTGVGYDIDDTFYTNEITKGFIDVKKINVLKGAVTPVKYTHTGLYADGLKPQQHTTNKIKFPVDTTTSATKKYMMVGWSLNGARPARPDGSAADWSHDFVLVGPTDFGAIPAKDEIQATKTTKLIPAIKALKVIITTNAGDNTKGALKFIVKPPDKYHFKHSNNKIYKRVEWDVQKQKWGLKILDVGNDNNDILVATGAAVAGAGAVKAHAAGVITIVKTTTQTSLEPYLKKNHNAQLSVLTMSKKLIAKNNDGYPLVSLQRPGVYNDLIKNETDMKSLIASVKVNEHKTTLTSILTNVTAELVLQKRLNTEMESVGIYDKTNFSKKLILINSKITNEAGKKYLNDKKYGKSYHWSALDAAQLRVEKATGVATKVDAVRTDAVSIYTTELTKIDSLTSRKLNLLTDAQKKATTYMKSRDAKFVGMVKGGILKISVPDGARLTSYEITTILNAYIEDLQSVKAKATTEKKSDSVIDNKIDILISKMIQIRTTNKSGQGIQESGINTRRRKIISDANKKISAKLTALGEIKGITVNQLDPIILHIPKSTEGEYKKNSYVYDAFGNALKIGNVEAGGLGLRIVTLIKDDKLSSKRFGTDKNPKFYGTGTAKSRSEPDTTLQAQIDTQTEAKTLDSLQNQEKCKETGVGGFVASGIVTRAIDVAYQDKPGEYEAMKLCFDIVLFISKDMNKNKGKLLQSIKNASKMYLERGKDEKPNKLDKKPKNQNIVKIPSKSIPQYEMYSRKLNILLTDQLISPESIYITCTTFMVQNDQNQTDTADARKIKENVMLVKESIREYQKISSNWTNFLSMVKTAGDKQYKEMLRKTTLRTVAEDPTALLVPFFNRSLKNVNLHKKLPVGIGVDKYNDLSNLNVTRGTGNTSGPFEQKYWTADAAATKAEAVAKAAKVVAEAAVASVKAFKATIAAEGLANKNLADAKTKWPGYSKKDSKADGIVATAYRIAVDKRKLSSTAKSKLPNAKILEADAKKDAGTKGDIAITLRNKAKIARTQAIEARTQAIEARNKA